MRHGARAGIVLLVATAMLAPAAAATAADDDRLGDHEQEDRRYYERRAQQPAAAAEPATPEASAGDREAETAAFLARADELIRDRNYRSEAGERYRVQTDDPRVDVRAVVALLEEFRRDFDGFWKDRVELRPYDRESRVFLFYSFYKFNELLVGDWRFHVSRPKGHYRPWFDAITIHTDPGGGQSLADTLLHEAAHQLVEQRLLGGQAPQAIWLSEGLASYFGYTAINREGLRPGVVGRKEVALLKGGDAESGAEARARLKEFNRAARGANAPFAEVMAIRDPAVFYGPQASRYYSASWLLVHFLLHGDDGAHAAGFARWLEAIAGGEPDADLLAEIGLGAPQLEEAALAHAKRLKVR